MRQGDTIVWTNHDIAPHTATARDKSWDSGRLKRGATFTATVSEDFDGPYFCRFHPMMKAAIKIHIVFKALKLISYSAMGGIGCGQLRRNNDLSAQISQDDRRTRTRIG